MNQDPNAHLEPQEFAALKEASKGPLKGVIPDVVLDRLIKLGFLKQGLGGPVLTDLGQYRLTKGR